jgi:hypothetical protein
MFRALEVSHDAVGAMLRTREDEHRIHLGLPQQFHEQRGLFVPRHGIHRVRHRARGRRAPPDLHDDRLAEVLPRECFDFGRHCRAEQQRLAIARDLVHDTVDLRGEPHIEHAVRLVEHEHLELIEHDVLAFEMIDEATRRCYDHIDSGAQRTLLRFDRYAPEHCDDAEARVLSILSEAVVDLGSQLAGGRENKYAGSLRPIQHSIDDGQRERCGLASARMGEADHVAPAESQRNGLALDRGGFGVAGVANGVEHLWAETELVERERSLNG